MFSSLIWLVTDNDSNPVYSMHSINVNYLAVMCIRLSPFSPPVPFCDCGLSKNPSYTTKLFICGMVRSRPVANIRRKKSIGILNGRIVCGVRCGMPGWNTYRSAFDRKRLVSQMVDRWPFSAAADSRVPACARTALCRGRLVDVIHECKSPERTALAPISFHHFHQTRTNFLFRFSVDRLHNRCSTTKNGKKLIIIFIIFHCVLWMNDFFNSFDSCGHWIRAAGNIIIIKFSFRRQRVWHGKKPMFVAATRHNSPRREMKNELRKETTMKRACHDSR